MQLEANLSWERDPSAPSSPTALTRRLGPGESFGLLEGEGDRWTLCIPDGALALVDDQPIDRFRLAPEPSGERRLLLAPGMRARVQMGPFSFSVRPAPRSS